MRLNKINEFVQDIVTADVPPTPVQIEQLNSFSKEALSKQSDYEQMLQKVLENIPGEEAPAADLAQDQDTINNMCTFIASNVKILCLSSESTSVSAISHGLPLNNAPNVQLPKLELKAFNGDLMEWVSFINLFNTTIHENASIPNVTKFQYLLSVLSGEPLALIKSLPLTAPNYDIAYDLLKERYHSPRRIVSLHLNQIIDLPSINHSSKQIRNFLNVFNEHTQALKALNSDITTHNPLLSAMLLRKMDSELRSKFEGYRSTHFDEIEEPHPLPSVSEITKFLTQQCVQIEEANLNMSSMNTSKPCSSTSAHYAPNKYSKSKNPNFDSKKVALTTVHSEQGSSNNPPICFMCHKTDHKIYSCNVFKDKSPKARFEIVKSNKRCVSCLGNHQLSECHSKSNCLTCNKRHHTLLHFENNAALLPSSKSSSEYKPAILEPQLTMSTQQAVLSPKIPSTVILGTTLVKLTAENGVSHVFRALLDSGSMCDFMSESAAQLLGSLRLKSNIQVVGLSQTSSRTKGLMNVNLETLAGKLISFQNPMHIVDKISINMPRAQISSEVLEKVKPYLLADPTFHLPGPIDVLIGGAIFPQLLTNQNFTLGHNLPQVIGTHFGFVLMGSAPCAASSQIKDSPATSLLSMTDNDLHTSLQRFWQLEEPPTCSKRSAEEQQCDDHFAATHGRDSEGRYIVQLPFKKDYPALGLSQLTAERRFRTLEHKLNTSPELHNSYSQNMTQHISQGHMVKLPDFLPSSAHYFLPHHAVIKNSSSSTKVRIVYDASSKTNTGISLNDTLMTGPKLQTNISDVLLHFRSHNIVFTCDIRQMYLQILVHPSHQCYQLILWRDNPSDEITVYKLTRVTFGLNSSPYLAIRTLHQLANDEGSLFPEAAEVLKSQTYVDDIVTGAETVEEALKLQTQLIQLLKKGGFELRKWVSNADELLQSLPKEHLETPVFLQETQQPHFTVLGLHWSPSTDEFTYNLNLPYSSQTKRQILSIIAQIYDPCGFLSPIVMWAKGFMQLLWAKSLQWDQPLPPELLDLWKSFINTSDSIRKIKIPRSLNISQSCSIELHGFSDASEQGYAAVIYLRCKQPNGSVLIRQIFSKTRVAPLKKVTLPRLELCGAHLLAQLVEYCRTIFDSKIKFSSMTLWCDSIIALTWLQSPPYRLKTFVANRVAQVQEIVPSHCWRHINSIHNPADCASRGILPPDLANHELWWCGPSWLQLPHDLWPDSHFVPSELNQTEETKPVTMTTLLSTVPEEWNILSKYSNFTQLQRVVAYILRFIHNIRHPVRYSGALSVQELKLAYLAILKAVQTVTLNKDITAIRKGQPATSSLRRLIPYLDEAGLLRVGGRLRHSNLQDEVRHPIILPKRHHVVNLLIDSCHKTHLHSGAQLTQSLLVRSVWILSARSIIRSRIFHCIICFKHNPKNKMPLMGDLPSPRVIPSRPFMNTGIDFGGPFDVKVHSLRNTRSVKVYICVFICLTIKAVHIEVVTDLSTNAFLAALTRFVSRRGLCTNIYCDCGTNFVGANNALQALLKKDDKSQIQRFSANQGIQFHFNPPAAPHQGGLWEAAIKSSKYHLRRVMGETILTLAEFMTLTTQVEAMLNSRPLTPLSSDPLDLTALTPGHFLIGTALAAVPEADFLTTPNNRLKHWHLVQAFQQRIWQRWVQEYLHTLQQRSKWTCPTRNLQVGDLVLIQQPSTTLSWPLARVISTYPGKDGVVRVVQLKTAQGTFNRPAHKVFPLPLTC